MFSIDLTGAFRELPGHWQSNLVSFIIGGLCGFFLNKTVWAWLTTRISSAKENRKRKEREQKEEQERNAYKTIRAHYDLAPDVNTLVAKDKADPRRYCLRCAKSGNLVALDSHGDNRWFCPACSWRSWPRKYGPNGVE